MLLRAAIRTSEGIHTKGVNYGGYTVTNYERLKDMSVEELASFVKCPRFLERDNAAPVCLLEKSCRQCTLDWLAKDVKHE